MTVPSFFRNPRTPSCAEGSAVWYHDRDVENLHIGASPEKGTKCACVSAQGCDTHTCIIYIYIYIYVCIYIYKCIVYYICTLVCRYTHTENM